MKNYILSKLFIEVYTNLTKRKLIVNDYDLLEETLENYLVYILGYRIRSNYQDNYYEIKKYFENIVYNSHDSKRSITDQINIYKEQFLNDLESHKYVNLFIETMKRLYSKSYDGKLYTGEIQNHNKNYDIIAISNIDKTYVLSKFQKMELCELPSTCILNIDNFEKILSDYIDSIKKSDSFYNIFYNDNFYDINEEEKTKIIFESTMLNASNFDLSNIQQFFKKYTDYITDETFLDFRYPYKIGDLFGDSLYVMSKRAELEYETPFYLSFMLQNLRVTLPNVRIGINSNDGEKSADIIALQSAQQIYSYENQERIEEEIKKLLPHDSYFRFYNPTHLVSIIMTFGLLNGMNIKDITVKDFLPFRYKKTILDKSLSEEEAYDYQKRLTNKNLATYMRLISIVDGVDIISYPELNTGLKLRLNDEIDCKNDFLQQIYDMCFMLGRKFNLDEVNKKI